MRVLPHHIERWTILLAAALLLTAACTKKPVGPALAVEPAVRVDNPFVDAGYYVNPDYAAKVLASRADAPNNLRDELTEVASTPVAVWLERIAAIEGEGGMGLEAHLDAALAQHKRSPGRPFLVALVLYDLPGRDCAASASAGELPVGDAGMRRYKKEFIDPIVEILARPKYAHLRIVTFLEPDSLPNLVTNLDAPRCAAAADGYIEGIAYAIQALARQPNVYIYLDMANAGWLGWDHARPAAVLYRLVLDRAGGDHLISGFVTNVSSYVPLDETFDPYENVDANKDIIEGLYQWNRILDAVQYVDSLRQFFPTHGFVIDTSRNGWEPNPDGPSDRRPSRSAWCNVAGAGLGERAMAEPREGVHAYFWVKPPGESDGTADPSDDRADPSCAPGPITGSLPGAPPAGEWFHESLLQLTERAEPRL
jgi:cellulose 1,4-beta-cellobiosidase